VLRGGKKGRKRGQGEKLAAESRERISDVLKVVEW